MATTMHEYRDMTNRYDRTAEDLAAERAMMGTPMRWPYSSQLSLKRVEPIDSSDPMSRWGTLVLSQCGAARVVMPIVYSYDGRELRRYQTFDEIQADGWVID